MKIGKVCILGGTGFVGRHLCARLSERGIACILPSRHPQHHRHLAPLPGLSLVEAEDLDVDRLNALFQGCDAAINLIGILNERKPGRTFRHVHVELVDHIVDAARAAGVRRLLHMSALNADEGKGTSLYLRTKGEGENRAHTLGGATMGVTSFRPSVIFGPDDSFFNRFAGLVRIPGPFPLACPDTRFAPVYVGDVTEAFARALEDRSTCGEHYELCGPRVFSLRELVEYTARALGRRKTVVALPDLAARLQARLLERLPGKPFSYDNYLSLQTDSLCTQDGLAALGIEPTDVDAVVPGFLSSSGPHLRLDRLRRRL